MKSTATFSDVVEMAKFCAELVRQGIVFHVKAWDDTSWVVEMTGGY